MNYLAHWHYARQQLQTPQYCLGLIWPDLSRSEPVQLVEGIKEHKALDMRFHSGTWMMSVLGELNREHHNKFACHVALELAVDKLLLHAHPALVKNAEHLLSSKTLLPVLTHQRYATMMVGKIVEGRLQMYGTDGGCTAVLASVLRRCHHTKAYGASIMHDVSAIVDKAFSSLDAELRDSKT